MMRSRPAELNRDPRTFVVNSETINGFAKGDGDKLTAQVERSLFVRAHQKSVRKSV